MDEHDFESVKALFQRGMCSTLDVACFHAVARATSLGTLNKYSVHNILVMTLMDIMELKILAEECRFVNGWLICDVICKQPIHCHHSLMKFQNWRFRAS
jgi:hypothetical protein